MNREEVRNELITISKEYNNILAELPTGFGKTKCALDILKEECKGKPYQYFVLIVVPRNVLKEEWKKEIEKWGADYDNITYEFTTYVSLDKHAGSWNFVIFDEAHHLSERCRTIINEKYLILQAILLSATVSQTLKEDMSALFPDLYCYKVKMKEAIENEILPDPKVYLVPLLLDNTKPTESIWKNPKGKDPVIETDWATRWSYIKQKNYKVRIYCTEKQYIEELNGQIDYWKMRYLTSRNDVFKNKWLRLCGERLRWLSEKKNIFILSLLDKLKNERTLTFCNNIEQTEYLGKFCINSKNKQSVQNLEDFNNGKIQHITACNMLNEGMNLKNCRVGIYANLNSSETIIKQRLGRILRHKNPIIIIPYYIGTREEELVEKMLGDYNPALIEVVENLTEIKI